MQGRAIPYRTDDPESPKRRMQVSRSGRDLVGVGMPLLRRRQAVADSYGLLRIGLSIAARAW